MNLNNVSALGSIVDALIICNYDMTIGGKSYKAGEPFTYLKQVSITIDSQSSTPATTVLTPTNKGMQMVDTVNFIDRLVISNVSMTTKVKSLFFNTIENANMVEWIVPTDPVSKLEHSDASDPFIFENGELLPSTRAYIDNGWLHIEDFDEMARYCGSYTHKEDLSSFVVENYPYFKIILLAQGNVDGKTSDQRLIFEKVSLMPQTSFTFAPTSQNNVTLVFGVIEPEKTVKVKL